MQYAASDLVGVLVVLGILGAVFTLGAAWGAKTWGGEK